MAKRTHARLRAPRPSLSEFVRGGGIDLGALCEAADDADTLRQLPNRAERRALVRKILHASKG